MGVDLAEPMDQSWPAPEWCRAFVVRVAELACGRVRVRAGGFWSLAELEEVSLTPWESLRVPWLVSGPWTGFADCRKAGGGQGAGALCRP